MRPGSSTETAAWPAVAQRVVTFVLLAAAASKLSTAVLLPLGFRIAATIAGVLAGMATPFYLLGLQADARSAVVTASLSPALTVNVGRLLFLDGLSRVQAVGIGVVLVGVVGVVAGWRFSTRGGCGEGDRSEVRRATR